MSCEEEDKAWMLTSCLLCLRQNPFFIVSSVLTQATSALTPAATGTISDITEIYSFFAQSCARVFGSYWYFENNPNCSSVARLVQARRDKIRGGHKLSTTYCADSVIYISQALVVAFSHAWEDFSLCQCPCEELLHLFWGSYQSSCTLKQSWRWQGEGKTRETYPSQSVLLTCLSEKVLLFNAVGFCLLLI